MQIVETFQICLRMTLSQLWTLNNPTTLAPQQAQDLDKEQEAPDRVSYDCFWSSSIQVLDVTGDKLVEINNQQIDTYQSMSW